MKIRLISDAHLEFGPLDLIPAGEDILILAGDIAIHTNHMEMLKRVAAEFSVPVIVIAGNHEFYRNGYSDQHTWEQTIDDLKAAADHTDRIVAGKVTYFEDSCAVYQGFRFVGATLWTDMKLFGDDPLVRFLVQKKLNDYRCIKRGKKRRRLRVYDVIERHEHSLVYITGVLDTPFDGPTVVVTHHAPSWLSVAEQYRDTLVSAAYASRLEEVILQHKPNLWVHGHTHISFDYTIGETRVVCNPRGYTPDDLNPDFNPNLMVEL